MKHYIASRFSKGNHFLPDEVIIGDGSITVKSPRFIGSTSISFLVNQVSVSVDSPILGFCDITFYSQGNRYTVHGFTDSEADSIKKSINFYSNSGQSQSTQNRSPIDGRKDLDDFFAHIGEMGRLYHEDKKKAYSNSGLLPKLKDLLISQLALRLVLRERTQTSQEDLTDNLTNNDDAINETRDKIRSYLKEIHEDWRPYYDAIRTECNEQAEVKFQKAKNDEFLKMFGWEENQEDS